MELDETERTLSAETLELLCCEVWPFNIRQLRSRLRRALLVEHQGDANKTAEAFPQQGGLAHLRLSSFIAKSRDCMHVLAC